ncbi:Gfo/Idh/MocA family protein [Oceanibium sediminis]|uniref:Gfo/Idh/MocA family protein n=1 Tax=Oceanibium sediminis TaxID=2026339 RepID=UPI000DD4E879|nr:Gfo/Idh/MocA family oxidoreductase [Oceanibium sediminis]
MIRVLVVGMGSIGARHAAAAAAHDRVRLVATVDLVSEGLAGVPHFARIEDVDVTVDAAVIATPTDSHAALGAAAAARGWAVLVEKPIAHTPDAGAALIDACRAAGVPLIVGHHRRTHRVVARARDLLAGGAIGDVLGVSGIWAVRKHEGYFDAPWRAGAGGSPVLINLVHDIDLLRHLLGEITELCPLLADTCGGGAEDSGALALRFASGALGTFLFSDRAPSPWSFEAATGENAEIAGGGADCYRFIGTAGALGFPSLSLWQGARDWREPLTRHAESVAIDPPLVAQLAHLADVVEHGAPPLCSGADGLAALTLALKTREGRPWKS